jgi:hypothetical protein
MKNYKRTFAARIEAYVDNDVQYNYGGIVPFIVAYPSPTPPPPTPSITASNTPTPSITASNTPTPNPTQTATPTQTNTRTPTPTPTLTRTPTSTQTPTNTQTQTNTPTNTASNTPTPSITATNTLTPTQTPTLTRTPTNTPTPSLTPGLNKWKADLLSDSGCGSADLSGYTGNKIIVNGVESALIPTGLGYRLNACLPQIPSLGIGVVLNVKCELVDALEFCDVPVGFYYDELEWTITSSGGLNIWNADLDIKYLGASQAIYSDQLNVDSVIDTECPRNIQSSVLSYPYFYARPV